MTMDRSMPKNTTPATPQWDAPRVALCSAVLPVWSRHVKTSVEQSIEAVSEMLFAFSQLGPVLEELKEVDPRYGSLENIRAQVERMYVGFQYQDRLSQSLELLLHDMSRMRQALHDAPHSPDALQGAVWLGRLESEYVMAEQHDHAATHRDSANEVTFF